MKLALALAATPLLASASMPSPFFINLELVEKIECVGGTGSGARIDDNLIVTVAHVASAPGCKVDGHPVDTVHIVPESDFAVVRSPAASNVRMTISCEPIREGEPYFAIGWAFGSQLVVQRYVGTDDTMPRSSGTFAGMVSMKGRGFPGMSGGPVVDSDGNVVGVHAGTNRSVSLAAVRVLSETYLCRH